MLRGQSKTLPVPSKRDVVLDTDSVFVPLRLEEASSAAGRLSHENLLKLGNRIRVIGDPGSGKSSLIKKMFRDECHRAVKRKRGARLPILIELRDLAVPTELSDADAPKWLLNELRERVSRAAVYRMTDCFDTYVETQGLLVLLDGLDEVATQRYPTVHRSITRLAETLAHLSSENVIVLTLRTHFHQQVRETLGSHFPHAAFVQPFTPTDIYDFLVRWPDQDDTRERTVQIYRDLMDRPTLREMCTNPLVLAMYVADYPTTGEALIPDTRTEFYATVSEELLVKRRLRQTGMVAAKSAIREQRERILGGIALKHLLDEHQPANSIPWNFSVQVTADATGLSHSEAEVLLREIGKETGLISEERVGESMRFIHLTFCEFLAAKEGVEGQEHGWSTLVSKHMAFKSSVQSWLHTRLVEVIAFGAGLTPRARRIGALNDVLSVSDPRLTIRAFLETKLYSHPAWEAFISSECERLGAQTGEMVDADWLQSVHLFNVVVRDAKNTAQYVPVQMPADLIDGFVRQISQRGGHALQALFSTLATHDAAAALRLSESAGFDFLREVPDVTIRCCDQAPFFAMIRHRALNVTHEYDYVLQLFAEAALRSAVVRSLYRGAPLQPVSPAVFSSPFVKEWLSPGFGIDPPIAALFGFALEKRRSAASKMSLPLLNVLDRAPRPGSYRWLRLAGVISFVALFPLIAILVYLIGALDPGEVTEQFGLPRLFIFAASFAVAVQLFAAYASVRAAYHDLLYGRSERSLDLELRSSPIVATLSPSEIRVAKKSRISVVIEVLEATRQPLREVLGFEEVRSLQRFPAKLRDAVREMTGARLSIAPSTSRLLALDDHARKKE
jgi:GTPase SAR1 family protein